MLRLMMFWAGIGGALYLQWHVIRHLSLHGVSETIMDATLSSGGGTSTEISQAYGPPVTALALSASDAELRTVSISAAGWVEGATREIGLTPAISERVREIPVREGEQVGAGDPLLRLDDALYQHGVELAASEFRLATEQLQRLKNGARAEERAEAAALHRAKLAELKHAQSTWQRTRELLSHRAASRQLAEEDASRVRLCQAEAQAAKSRVDLLEAEARPDDVRIAEAKVQAARANLDLARARLQRTTLTAPISGTVLRINVEAGELIDAESDEPSVIMADLSRLRVRAFVDEMDSTRVTEGMSADIRVDGLPGQTFAGCLTRVSPRITRKRLWTHDPSERYDTKAREVWIDLQGAPKLVIGLQVDVLIQTSPNRHGLAQISPDDTNRKTLPAEHSVRVVSAP